MGSAAPSAVGVDDPGLGGEALRDLVGVVSRRQAGADVEELPDAIAFRQAAHRVGQEQPGEPGDQRHRQHDLEDAFGGGPVGGEVVLAALEPGSGGRLQLLGEGLPGVDGEG